MFDPGFDVTLTQSPLGFHYGPGVFGPRPEIRHLDDIRKSLRDPECTGPDIVYAIAMDIGKAKHRQALQDQMLLYGAVVYAAGSLGQEPVRSQGHVHRVSRHSGWSPPELYEIWTGKAVILMQEHARDFPGRCLALEAGPGQTVLVPPGWAHMTISADPRIPLSFGAWCDREYGFEYEGVRSHGGLAWYPLLEGAMEVSRDTPKLGNLVFAANPNYQPGTLVCRGPNDYSTLGLVPGVPVYRQYEKNPELFRFISEPGLFAKVWEDFIP